MDKGFGQFCPVALASETLTQKWSLLIVRELCAGSSRFNDIKRGVPRISATLLKQRLAALETAQIVERRAAGRSGGFDYALTAAGEELRPILSCIGVWGQRWARDIRKDDLDPGWLVWNMRRRLDLGAMPRGRTVLEFEFTDAPARQRRFWLVVDRGEVEICLKPPGFAADVAAKTTVRVLAEIWRGMRAIKDEIRAGRLSLEGTPANLRAFPDWLMLSVYASTKTMRRKGNSTAP